MAAKRANLGATCDPKSSKNDKKTKTKNYNTDLQLSTKEQLSTKKCPTQTPHNLNKLVFARESHQFPLIPPTTKKSPKSLQKNSKISPKIEPKRPKAPGHSKTTKTQIDQNDKKTLQGVPEDHQKHSSAPREPQEPPESPKSVQKT